MLAKRISDSTPAHAFTGYEKFVVAVLAFLQFTIILDFMILSPLGAILIPALNITTSQFGAVVSAYAFSAGASGLLAAGFADRFDRKKLLLFFYTGFVLGTLFCGLAPNYHYLLAARIITGIFGGVIGSICFAIITDLFVFEKRGRVMGLVQTAFAGSQILGLPIGLYLANNLGWHAPFIMIVGVSVVAGLVILLYLKPVNDHLKMRPDRKAFHHLAHTISQKRYLQGFLATALLSVGGFMIMPFSSAFNVHNLGIDVHDLPILYLIVGMVSILAGPMAGRLSDRMGSFPIFVAGSFLTVIVAAIYTRLDPVPFWILTTLSCLMFIGVSARMIASSTLTSALPAATDRGAYMSISSSLQQISGGIAAAIGGIIVVQNADGSIGRFDILGDVVILTAFVTMILMFFLNRYLQSRKKI